MPIPPLAPPIAGCTLDRNRISCELTDMPVGAVGTVTFGFITTFG